VVKVFLLAGAISLFASACTAGGPAPSDGGVASDRPTVAYPRGGGGPVEILPELQGVPLRDPTGLQLLVGDTLVDVDLGTQTTVTGLPVRTATDNVLVQMVANQAVITYEHTQCLECDARLEVFVVAPGATDATRIATDVAVAPADGALWAMRYESDTRCVLSMIALDGSSVGDGRRIGCEIVPLQSTTLGLLVFDQEATEDVILDPETLRELVSAGDIVAVIGERVLVEDLSGFSLADGKSGRERSLGQPAAVGVPMDGVVSPSGRYVAVEFRNPAQYMDLWVLDLETSTWIHAPSMPVLALIKRTPPLWTCDERLVMLGSFGLEDEQDLVIWSPDQPELSIRRVDYPEGSFVVRC
jgi:hypothetical protein